MRWAGVVLDDRGYFEEKTGKPQIWAGKLNGYKLSWMEPYCARFRYPRLKPWLTKFRPIKGARTGGNVTVLYGQK